MNILDGFYNSDSQNKKAHTHAHAHRYNQTKLGSDAFKLIACRRSNRYGIENKELLFSVFHFESSCLDLEREKGAWEDQEN